MMLSQLEQFRTRKDENVAAVQSVRLGTSTLPVNTNSFTAVQPLPRKELNRGTIPNLVNGYSSLGFDINPFDIAYRAGSQKEYAKDFGYFLLRTTTAGLTGGADKAVLTAFGIVIDQVTD